MRRRPALSFGLLAVLAALCESASCDVAGRLGGGNVGRDLERMRQQMTALESIGAGRCRMPVHPRLYGLVTGKARPGDLDDRVLLAHEHGIEPILLFEYYTRWDIPLGGYDKWFRAGRVFAERFAPNSRWLRSRGIDDWGVTYYSAINEPVQRRHNPTPLTPEAYTEALKGLADGVHSVGVELRVSPGGWSEIPLRQNKNPYVRAVAPLFNSGKLHSICIHRYWDVDHVPMAGRYDWSLQSQFDEVKRAAGVTADIAFCTDEVNVKLRKRTEPDAARDFLTALWDALGVVGRDGQPVSEFVMPWNVFHTNDRDRSYGLCTELSPWTPTERGKVLHLVGELTEGMEFVRADPKGEGVYVLEGSSGKLWVWQNREGWTRRPSSRFRIDDLPPSAESVEVYGWDGLRETLRLRGKRPLVVDGLATGETYMFLAQHDTQP